jgi:ComF family protein
MQDAMKGLLNWISDLLWPLSCLGCSRKDVRLCPDCLTGLCGNEHVQRRSGPHLDRLLSAGTMRSEVLSRAIWHLKYRNAPDLASPLADILATAAGRAALLPARDTVVVPVPLHARRKRSRGYNQAALLAERLSAVAMLPCLADVLVRERATGPQVGTADRDARLANMEGAFACWRPELVRGRSVFLVDDVCTTGATLGACAAALKSVGARSVTGIVLARG